MSSFRRASRVLLPAALALLLHTAPAPAAACTGDCGGDGQVTVDELIRAVNIALGTAAPASCPSADANGDTQVTIDEIVAAVNRILTGCPVPETTPTPTASLTPAPATPASPTPTPTLGSVPGILWLPVSNFSHTVGSFDLTSLSLMMTVNGLAETTATVTLARGDTSVPIPYASTVTFSGLQAAVYNVSDLRALPYVAGATYTLTAVTSAGTASLSFVAPGEITIAADGSQIAWTHDGSEEEIQVYAPSNALGFRAGPVDLASPFPIPAEAYGEGAGSYRVAGTVRRTFAEVAGAAPESRLAVSQLRFANLVPAVTGPTFTPSQTRTSTPTRTATPTPTATATFTGTIEPTPILEGEILFSSSRAGESRIFVMNPDGGDVVQLSNGPGFDESPEWSPDKAKIVFTRDYRLHLMNADGTDVTPLRPDFQQYDPTFSPDGGRIVYAEFADGRTNLFAYALASATITRLTDGAWTDSFPSFTPDGRHIFFTSQRDDALGEIYRMDADGSNVVRITTNTDFEFLGEVSPDGTKLAYAARAATGTQSLAVFVSDIDGSNAVALTSTQDRIDDENPVWSPDGAYLAWRPFVGNRAQVYRMQANGLFATDLSRNDAREIVGDWR